MQLLLKNDSTTNHNHDQYNNSKDHRYPGQIKSTGSFLIV